MMLWLLLLCVPMSLFGLQEKPMVVIVPSYNNHEWYQRNLDSIFEQSYDNYRVVYVNDCSTDDTGQLVAKYIREHDCGVPVQLINNDINRGALYNLYHAIHACDDHEIVVTLDGDDSFKDAYVLQRVNEAYQDKNVWLTYGQFESYPSGKKGFCRDISRAVVQHRAYRAVEWVTSHLRTFYAKLFKQIKLQDLVHENELYRVTWDMAFLFPMLEMAHGRIKCITDVLYVYNEANPINDYKTKLLKQLQYDKYIRSKRPYTPLDDLWCKNNVDASVDLVVLAHYPDNVCGLLDKLRASDASFNQMSVLCENAQRASMGVVCKRYPEVQLVSFGSDCLLSERIEAVCAGSGYVLITTDDVELNRRLPLTQALQWLQRTQALCVHCALDNAVTNTPLLKRAQKIPPLVDVADGFLAFSYSEGEFDWARPFDLRMNVCKKSDLALLLDGAKYEQVDQLRYILQQVHIDPEAMGLCLERACMRPGVVKQQKKEIGARSEIIKQLQAAGYGV